MVMICYDLKMQSYGILDSRAMIEFWNIRVTDKKLTRSSATMYSIVCEMYITFSGFI